jgi:hypothetical protein
VIPRIPTHPAAFRVFAGFKLSDLEEAEFLRELGEVFMPGTPLLLRDFGLAAYLPAVLPTSPGDAPDEVAIIAYASPERYAHVRRETIVGRMYTYTHRGVFDMDRSRSQQPSAIGGATGPVTAFWCFGEPCDWQADGDVIVWAGRAPEGEEAGYPERVLAEVKERLHAWREEGVHECVGQVGRDWCSLWLLKKGFTGEVSAALAESLETLAGSHELLSQTAIRLAWLDQPPVVPVVRGGAWTFIFARAADQFLS